MSSYNFSWQPHARAKLVLSVGTELWYDTLADGVRHSYLVSLGIGGLQDVPNVRVYTLVILWFAVRLGIRWGK